MCLYGKLIPNPKYKPNKKNGGHPPPVYDDRIKHVPIGCKECMECRKEKARNWQLRLLEDIKTNTNGKFITLTFNNTQFTKLLKHLNDNYPEIQGYALDNAIATVALRRFNERYRKRTSKALRHWCVTELGHNGTENVHLHGIIWTNDTFEQIEKDWKYGFIWPTKEEQKRNYVNGRTVNYIIKYVHKMDADHRHYVPLILTSPGIGSDYTNSLDFKKHKYNGTETIETYRTSTGHKMAMPIYWRNKAYTEQEREQLWLHKLDKQIRYIQGEKIDISKTEEEYYKILQWYQDKNAKLGYGNGHKDWTQKRYEEQRRAMLHAERSKKQTPSARSLAKGLGLNCLRNRSHKRRNNTELQHSHNKYNIPNIPNIKIIQIHKSLWKITPDGLTTIEIKAIENCT